MKSDDIRTLTASAREFGVTHISLSTESLADLGASMALAESQIDSLQGAINNSLEAVRALDRNLRNRNMRLAGENMDHIQAVLSAALPEGK